VEEEGRNDSEREDREARPVLRVGKEGGNLVKTDGWGIKHGPEPRRGNVPGR